MPGALLLEVPIDVELLEGVSLSGAAEGTKSARGARRRQRRTESRRTRATNKPTSSRNEEQLITSFIECQELGAARDHRHGTQTGCATVVKVPPQAAPTISSALCPAIAVESLQLRRVLTSQIKKLKKRKRKKERKGKTGRNLAGTGALLLEVPVDEGLLEGVDGTKRLTVVRCC